MAHDFDYLLVPMFSAFGYTFTERLGKGTYGEVFKAIHKVIKT